MISKETQELVDRLLKTPSSLLVEYDRQRAFLAREFSRTAACPECGRQTSYLEAVSESFDFDKSDSPRCECPECKTELVKVLPFMGGWYWSCVGLIVPGRNPPSIRTLDAYDSWMRQFKDGIDAAVEVGRGAAGGGSSPLRLGPVSGAFAFAHKANPKKTEAFMAKVRDGVGLEAAEPAYTLRQLLTLPAGAGRRGSRGGDRYILSKKVLSALFADLKGRNYGKAQAGNEGLEFYRAAYDGRTIDKLVSLWSPESPIPKPSATAA